MSAIMQTVRFLESIVYNNAGLITFPIIEMIS